MRLKLNVRLTAFKRFLIQYLLIVLIVIIILIPVYITTVNQSIINEINKRQNMLEVGIGRFEDMLYDLHKVRFNLEDLMPHNLLSIKYQMQDGIDTYNIREVGIQINNMIRLSEYVEDIIIIYTRSGSVVTKNGGSIDSKRWADNYVKYNNLSMKDFIDLICNKDSLTFFIPNQEIILARAQKVNGITYVMKALNRSTIICGIINADKLVDMFGINEIGKGALLYITSQDGQVIFEYSNDAPGKADNISDHLHKNYTMIQKEIPSICYNVVIGIPKQVYLDNTRSVRYLILIYITIAVILGSLLAVVFAFLSYKPIQRLLKDNSLYNKYKSKQTPIDEFAYIDDVLHKYDSLNESLKEEIIYIDKNLKSNLFLRALKNDLSKNEDRNALMERIPLLNSSFRLVLLSFIGQGVQPEDATVYYAILREHLSTMFENTYEIERYSTSSIVVLLANEAHMLLDTINALNKKFTQQHSARVTVGISSSHTDLSELNDAFYEASFVAAYLSLTNENLLQYESIYISDGLACQQSAMRKIYALLHSCECCSDINYERIFNSLESDSILSRDQCSTLFYKLRNIIEEFMLHHGFLPSVYLLPEYRPSATANMLFSELTKLCDVLLSEMETRRMRTNQELATLVIHYINNNFSNNNLTLYSITDSFNIPEGVVQAIIKEKYEQSFHAYLEYVRISNAAELLKNTDQAVAQISERCGFYSIKTFYRLFRKHYHMAPSEYRTIEAIH